jgi:hypothetical protein
MTKTHKHSKSDRAQTAQTPPSDAPDWIKFPRDDLTFSNFTISRSSRFSLSEVTGAALGAFMLGAFAMMVLRKPRSRRGGPSHAD